MGGEINGIWVTITRKMRRSRVHGGHWIRPEEHKRGEERIKLDGNIGMGKYKESNQSGESGERGKHD